LILPVLLAVIGVISLAIAVMLVPVIIRESLAQAAVAYPLRPEQAAAPVAPAPSPAPTPTPPAPVPDPVAEPAAAEVEPIDAAPRAEVADEQPSAHGPWTIRVNVESYKPIEQGPAALEQLAAYLKAHPQTSANLTGINNPMRSRKKAKYAARRIKELLIATGVERYRLRTAGAQEEGAEGLLVRAEIAGGER
jgi:hypothetical protein